MILQNVGMVAAQSNRTRFYLSELAQADLFPAHVIYLDDPDSTPESLAQDRSDDGEYSDMLNMSVVQMLEQYGIPYQTVPTKNPNDPLVVDAVKACKQSILIYSGPGGAILRRPILTAGKKFLHAHPGILPAFRGSTTIYYSLIAEGCCGVTAFFLDEKIDNGPVVRRREFEPPADRQTIDLTYDPWIRAQVIVDVLREYADSGRMPSAPPDKSAGETYFIIHPVLKHIALLSSRASQ